MRRLEWTGEAFLLRDDALPPPREVDVAAPALPDVSDAAALAISFTPYKDGRGFSVARRLRRLGYTGPIIATGQLFLDQFRQAVQCGFDMIASDDLPDADRATAAVHHYGPTYQATEVSRPIWELRT